MGLITSRLFGYNIPEYVNKPKLNLDGDEEFKKLTMYCEDQIYSLTQCNDDVVQIITKLSGYRPLYIKAKNIDLKAHNIVEFMLTYDQQVLCLKFKDDSVILWYDESLTAEQKDFLKTIMNTKQCHVIDMYIDYSMIFDY